MTALFTSPRRCNGALAEHQSSVDIEPVGCMVLCGSGGGSGCCSEGLVVYIHVAMECWVTLCGFVWTVVDWAVHMETSPCL